MVASPAADFQGAFPTKHFVPSLTDNLQVFFVAPVMKKEVRRVLVGYEDDRGQFEHFGVFTRLGRSLYQIFGYGYRPHVGALIFAAAVFLGGWALISLADHNRLMVPSRP